MPKISVANIKIDFKYVYPDYFEKLLEPYLIDEKEVNHRITVHVSTDFDIVEGYIHIASYKNRHVYESNNEIHIVAYDDSGICKQYIRHTKDYKDINIYLHASDTNERLMELEYVLTGLLFVELALFHNRLAIHSSAIMVEEEGILFSASSGTGKSTHTQHWISKYDASFINDDKPLIYKCNEEFVVSGTPWCGKEFLHSNITVPVRAIVFLERGDNLIIDMSNKEKVVHLMKNSIRPRNKHLMEVASNIIEELITQIPMVRYQATIAPSSAQVIYKYLFGGHDEN